MPYLPPGSGDTEHTPDFSNPEEWTLVKALSVEFLKSVNEEVWNIPHCVKVQISQSNPERRIGIERKYRYGDKLIFGVEACVFDDKPLFKFWVDTHGNQKFQRFAYRKIGKWWRVFERDKVRLNAQPVLWTFPTGVTIIQQIFFTISDVSGKVIDYIFVENPRYPAATLET